MYILVSLLVCIVGLVIYVVSTGSKPNEIGRLMFFAGMLAFLLLVRADTIRLL